MTGGTDLLFLSDFVERFERLFGIVDFMIGKACFSIAFFKMQPRKRNARAWFVFLTRAVVRIVTFMIGKRRFSMNTTMFSKAVFKDLEAESSRRRRDPAHQPDFG